MQTSTIDKIKHTLENFHNNKGLPEYKILPKDF